MAGEKHEPRTHERSISDKADSRLQEAEGEKRTGSDSNAHSGRKQSRLHENHRYENEPVYPPEADVSGEIRPHDRAGEDHGENQALLPGIRIADEIKSLHTVLADLTNDELRTIMIVPEGTRLEQGARYIDLKHLEQGEFVATAHMVAGPDNYYVPKKDTDYVLWNRLNQVDAPARLDESHPEEQP